jgi:hypothetical protein
VRFGIEFGGEPQDVTIAIAGVADIATSLRLYIDLTADPRYRPGLLILADIRLLTRRS